MKTTTRILTAVAAAASLALAGGVFAQSGYGPGWGGMGPGWGGMGPGMGGWGGGGPGWGHMGGWGGMGAWGGGGPGWGHMGGWGGGPGWGHMGGYGMGFGGYGYDMSQAAAARLADFKSALKITPDQEGRWKAYESAVTEQAKAMQALRDQVHEQWRKVKPGDAVPDMSAQYQAMFALRQSGWEKQNKALKELYAALAPDQQALMDGGWGPRGLPRR